MRLQLNGYAIVLMLGFVSGVNAMELLPGLFAVTPKVQKAEDLFALPRKAEGGDVPDIPLPSRSSAGSAAIDSRVFIVGGHIVRSHYYPPVAFSARAQSYDMASGRWTKIASRPFATQGFGMAATKRNGSRLVYAFGGFAYSESGKPQYRSLDNIDVYDVSADQWSTLDVRLPYKRSSYGVGVIAERAFLIGGWNATPRWEDDIGGNYQRSIDVFDLVAETADTLRYTSGDAPECQAPRRAFASVVVGDEIVMVGGLGPNGEFDLLKSVCSFKPKIVDTATKREAVVTGTWRVLPSLKTGIFAAGAGAIGRTIYVFGGLYADGDGGYADTILKLDLDSGKEWEQLTKQKLKVARGFIQVVPLADGTLGLFGGHAGHIAQADDRPVNIVESFRP